MKREQMNIVIVGHVDHGKSTVIGRLLADTGSLPQGKLEQVRTTCKNNSKPFEYSFLLDALQDEQDQGITIDAARCFFKTDKRDYIVIDAPGHIEFLKNMVTGAARAEAAVLVIDAKEGIQENSKRHGYLVSMLGIKQVVVVVNKLDLVDYSESVFEQIQKEYRAFLKQINVDPISFIPVSAFEGDNLVNLSPKTEWYQGKTILQQLDHLKKKSEQEALPFRFPVQDIYKFTEEGDDRRIVAGTVETGSIQVGDEVVFLPSDKRSRVKAIESFNTPIKTTATKGEAIGFTLDTQIYIKPGELMVKAKEKLPLVRTQFKANLFWLGKAPLIKGKNYKLKISTTRAQVQLVDILSVLDASELTTVTNKKQIDRHDVAECIFETTKPIAFDLIDEIESTGRFVLVDNYEIAGGGVIIAPVKSEGSILKKHIQEREFSWEKSLISLEDRENFNGHKSKFIVFTGLENTGKRKIAHALEKRLFEDGHRAYYLGMGNISRGLDSDITAVDSSSRDEQIRRLGELARVITGSGQIFITSLHDVDDYDLDILKKLTEPNELLVINVGVDGFVRNSVNVNLDINTDTLGAVDKVIRLLRKEQVIEYFI